jgi:hypothetical protein
MSFFKFNQEDIINTYIQAFPGYTVESNGDKVTGSIELERSYLTSSLFNRTYWGFSERLGGLTSKVSPFTSSIEMIDVEKDVTNEELYDVVSGSYNFYSSLMGTQYSLNATSLRLINVPEIYYDKAILTGSFTASDKNGAGADRVIFDNGRGGLYSGSMTGTLVGQIFYSEGLVVLTASDLLNFGAASSTNFDWRVKFKGVHRIPVKVFRCRAPAGQLNASTNETFYSIPESGQYKNQRVAVMSESFVYVSTVGLYNENYELVGVARIAQPIKKDYNKDILFRIRLDM